MTLKRIGLLTSGGDCAGLNAAIRGVVHRAIVGYNLEVYGIRNGTEGLAARPPQATRLDLDSVNTTMLRQGGTILGSTNKGDPFANQFVENIKEGLKLLQLDALIGIGGDGGLSIQNKLSKMVGIPFVGIPKTMDNDVGVTEVSIGFDTAVEVATEAIDRLQPTAASHSRVMVLEVMGRDAGHVALEAGLAGGADVILIPEIPWKLESIVKKIDEIHARGRNHALVVVSEAIKTADGTGVQHVFKDGQKRYGGIGQYIGDLITDATKAETRVTVLGHVQRGAAPTHTDRRIALSFGVAAVDLVAQGKFGHMVAWANRGIIDVEITDEILVPRRVNPNGTRVHAARALGVCLGD